MVNNNGVCMIEWILKFLGPIAKILTHIKIPFIIKKFTGEDCGKLLTVTEFGTILLTTAYGYSLNIFNPMKLKHGAIFVGNFQIAEMAVAGPRIVNVLSFLFSKDIVVAIKPLFSISQEKALAYLSEHKNDKYDWEFSKNNSEIYCFELIAKMLEFSSEEPIIINTFKKNGVEVYGPESFLQDTIHFKIVFLSGEAIRKNVLK